VKKEKEIENIEYSDEIIGRQNKLLQELQAFTNKHTSEDLFDGVLREDTITTFLLFKIAQMEYIMDTIPAIFADMYDKFAFISEELKKLKEE
jgi:hypothetical protein